jgi:uncharacterized protein
MAHVQIHRDDLDLEAPTLVEGLPGIGLVGKIATDHLITEYDMVHYGSLHCEGLPEFAVYQSGERGVTAPVRLYADPERDLLALTSDAPVSPSGAEDFASCLTGWLEANDVQPVFLSGLPSEKDGVPGMRGVATGDAGAKLDELDIKPPNAHGAVTGPTGALLYETQRTEMDAIGLIVEADPQFPDPEAARVILLDGISALADIDVDTSRLVEKAEEIADAKNQLAKQMEQAADDSTSAGPIGMYQ